MESTVHTRWPKYWSFSFNISPSNEYSVLISFRIDWFDLLDAQGTYKCILQHHSLKASILQHSAFCVVQLSCLYMTLGKAIVLTIWTSVGKETSPLFNTLSRFVITFLLRRKCLNFVTAVIIHGEFGGQKRKIFHCFHFPPSICHEVMEPGIMILVF